MCEFCGTSEINIPAASAPVPPVGSDTPCDPVLVIGAGLAGCEAAWQLAERGVPVTLCEMKPEKMSPAHHSPLYSELVCSNSLRSDRLESGPGLLKEELRRVRSLVLRVAEETRVDAGGALAVDRTRFSERITELVTAHPRITVQTGEVLKIPRDRDVIVATGPLTDGALAADIQALFGEPLFFFDAAAPLVSASSIDPETSFMASRYDRGSDYINCPMTREEYLLFQQELANAQMAPVKGFEDDCVFEGCLPVEVLARRGEDALRFGPLKPVGLRDPRSGEMPYAVLQLRRDNAAGDIYNLVGCQTHLTIPEQKRVFSLIPALKNAEYLRFGVMHRNSYLNAPTCLDRYFAVKSGTKAQDTGRALHFAGQITGVEGYIESVASGFVAGLTLARRRRGLSPVDFPRETAIGALSLYISNEQVQNFQPMNINFGLFPPLSGKRLRKRERYAAYAARALEYLDRLLPDIVE